MYDATAPLVVPAAALRPATTERTWVRWVLTGIAIAFLLVFLLMPLISVFVEAFAKGVGAYIAAITEKDSLAAIRLTLLVAAISVPANLIFGVAAVVLGHAMTETLSELKQLRPALPVLISRGEDEDDLLRELEAALSGTRAAAAAADASMSAEVN